MPKFGNWQEFIDKILQDIVVNAQFESFKILDNDCDRTEWIKSNVNLRSVKWISKYFEDVKCSPSAKCAKAAEELRVKGNEQFKNKNYKQAVQLYSQCVMVAPHKSQSTELALGFANRSAALFYLQLYQSCLSDITAGLTCGYPEDQKHKLIFRKAQAYSKLSQKREAISAFSALEECGPISDPAWKKKLDVLKHEIQALIDPQENPEKSVVKVTHGANKVIPLATSAVDLKFTQEKGRHVVAAQHISAGDTLVVEKAYAWILLPPYYSTHCHHCCGTMEVPYPCHHCTDAKYCSTTCQQDSWESYHKFECLYLDLFHSIGIAHLGVRVILETGLAKIREFVSTLQHQDVDEKVRNGFDETGVYGKSYDSMFWLLSHTQNIDPRDLLQYAVTALLLNCFLEEAGFFSESEPNSTATFSTPCESSNPSDCVTHSNEVSPKNSVTSTECCFSSDIQHQVGGLLLRHICQLVCNGHAIREKLVVAEMNSVDVVEEQRIATAIYPTASLLNHSCKPNVIASFDRNCLIFKAAEDIEKGEEVFNCYGPQGGKMSFEERQLILKSQYFFTCDCSACQQGSKIDVSLKAYKCSQCDGASWWKDEELKCLTCSHGVDPTPIVKLEEKTKKLFKEALICLKKQDCKAGISALEECVNLRRQILYEHNKDLSEAQDALARCYAMTGNFKRSAELLSRTTASTECVYGSNSVELANELQKYAEVLYESGAQQESLKAAKRALKIIRTSFPDNHGMVQELQEMVASLALNT